ncbi:hypothetical protein YB2330_006500 [Saitoella coloradoensis]
MSPPAPRRDREVEESLKFKPTFTVEDEIERNRQLSSGYEAGPQRPSVPLFYPDSQSPDRSQQSRINTPRNQDYMHQENAQDSGMRGRQLNVFARRPLPTSTPHTPNSTYTPLPSTPAPQASKHVSVENVPVTMNAADLRDLFREARDVTQGGSATFTLSFESLKEATEAMESGGASFLARQGVKMTYGSTTTDDSYLRKAQAPLAPRQTSNGVFRKEPLGTPSTGLFIRGYPNQFTEDDLRRFFPTAISSHARTGQKGGQKGKGWLGFVNFASVDAAKEASELPAVESLKSAGAEVTFTRDKKMLAGNQATSSTGHQEPAPLDDKQEDDVPATQEVLVIGRDPDSPPDRNVLASITAFARPTEARSSSRQETTVSFFNRDGMIDPAPKKRKRDQEATDIPELGEARFAPEPQNHVVDANAGGDDEEISSTPKTKKKRKALQDQSVTISEPSERDTPNGGEINLQKRAKDRSSREQKEREDAADGSISDAVVGFTVAVTEKEKRRKKSRRSDVIDVDVERVVQEPVVTRKERKQMRRSEPEPSPEPLEAQSDSDSSSSSSSSSLNFESSDDEYEATTRLQQEHLVKDLIHDITADQRRLKKQRRIVYDLEQRINRRISRLQAQMSSVAELLQTDDAPAEREQSVIETPVIRHRPAAESSATLPAPEESRKRSEKISERKSKKKSKEVEPVEINLSQRRLNMINASGEMRKNGARNSRSLLTHPAFDNLAMTTSLDGSVRFWNAHERQIIHEVTHEKWDRPTMPEDAAWVDPGVIALAASSSGNRGDPSQVSLLQFSVDSRCRTVDATPHILPDHPHEGQGVCAIAAFGQGKESHFQFATSGFRHEVYVWDINRETYEAESIVSVHKTHTAAVRGLEWEGSRNWLVSADSKFVAWDMTAQREARTIKFPKVVHAIQHNPVNKALAMLTVGSRNNQLRLIDYRVPENNSIVREFDFGSYHSGTAAISSYIRGAWNTANPSMFTIGTHQGKVLLWDIRFNKNNSPQVLQIHPPDKKVLQTAFLGSDTMLTFGSENMINFMKFKTVLADVVQA